MSKLKDNIKDYIEVREIKIRKEDKLLENLEEIREMMNSKIPITHQVKIILESGVLEKLANHEYIKFLEKHLNYKKRSNSKSNKQEPKIKTTILKTPSVKQEPIKKNTPPKSAKDLLSEEINLF